MKEERLKELAEMARKIKAQLVFLFKPSPKEQFLRLFATDAFGQLALDRLEENELVDVKGGEITWKGQKLELAALLMYLNRGIWENKYKTGALAAMANQIFKVEIKATTIRNWKNLPDWEDFIRNSGI